MEIKTRSNGGWGQRERSGKREEDGSEFWASRGEVVHPYRSILARRTLSLYLVFNDLSTHQIPDPLPLSLSLRIRCLSFFHVALFPPAPRRDERAIPSKKPSLEQYFRADRSHKKAKTTSCVSDGANNTWRYRYPGKIDNTFPWNRLNRD